ncbi:hypothetical protein EPUS_05377 [Endocarpon pusillum Z07020]|uniref:DUF6594 domain-containing protein n=1 Tax=Endocarpon pusillum (strain Z07020 / HMAS-L-300199) TaxID=1263415 RepID=U1HX07_ENDPU|nr:uncharacterized protein EPUS_05377 [Endocarpon pusillum Z07020]ERF73954.1 hypothetical protein EPUS_05377 [Endocarpon pusillum Z07020]
MTTPLRRITGYEKIALTMSKHDDLSIFRRFDILNAQNLLYLQAELHILEWEFQEQLAKDLTSTEGERKYYAFDWKTLDRVYQENQAILLYAETKQLQKPQRSRWSVLENILYRYIEPSDRLLGLEQNIWQEDRLRDDFVSLHPHPPQDLITRWLLRYLHKPYHRLIGKRNKTPDDPDRRASSPYEYDSNHLQYPVFVLTMVLSSLLPVVAIVILINVQSMGGRLGTLACFTAGFSLLLSLIIPDRLTKRVEIFAATAA